MLTGGFVHIPRPVRQSLWARSFWDVVLNGAGEVARGPLREVLGVANVDLCGNVEGQDDHGAA
jgi:hypothetical protein